MQEVVAAVLEASLAVVGGDQGGECGEGGGEEEGEFDHFVVVMGLCVGRRF